MNAMSTLPARTPGQARPAWQLSVLLGAGLALLALTLGYPQLAKTDHDLLNAFATLRGPLPNSFLQAVTWLGSGYLLAPATLLLVVVLAAKRHAAAGWLMATTYFGAALSTWVLKQAIERERPTLYPALTDIPHMDWSFPSGHTTHAAAFALGLWLVMRERSGVPWLAGIALSGLVLLVAASRLYLQVHWPSDVLAGLCVAILWAGLATALVRVGMSSGRSP
jgi:membrane-associated phospholipid phosphatase